MYTLELCRGLGIVELSELVQAVVVLELIERRGLEATSLLSDIHSLLT